MYFSLIGSNSNIKLISLMNIYAIILSMTNGSFSSQLTSKVILFIIISLMFLSIGNINYSKLSY